MRYCRAMERAPDWLTVVATATGATVATQREGIQTLWNGYGEIVRVALSDARQPSVVVKQVRPPRSDAHPRGFGGDRSHARKLRSYEVEAAFYQHFAARCGEGCRVPAVHAIERDASGWLFVLEDLCKMGSGLLVRKLFTMASL